MKITDQIRVAPPGATMFERAYPCYECGHNAALPISNSRVTFSRDESANGQHLMQTHRRGCPVLERSGDDPMPTDPASWTLLMVGFAGGSITSMLAVMVALYVARRKTARMTTANQPSILAVMADLMAATPKSVKRELHVAEPVWSFLRDTYAKAISPDLAATMMGLPIVVDADLTGGQWEIHEDGQATTSGDMAPAPEGMAVMYSPHAGWLAVTPTMEDLYPNGRGYHDAHEAYIGAVAKALTAEGLHVDDWAADANDPRDGFIGLDVAMNGESHPDNPIWRNAEVNVGWSEDRGWWLVTVKGSYLSDGRFVYDLPVGRVAAPANVASEVAQKIGDGVSGNTDDHPDLDFPDHSFDVDDVPFELALRHYQEAAK